LKDKKLYILTINHLLLLGGHPIIHKNNEIECEI
jgi:hypothetical protein